MPSNESRHGSGDGSGESADSFLREVAGLPDPSPGKGSLPIRLQQGEVIADRFVIQRLAGRGGMGAVYRALDRMTGLHVALKLVSADGGDHERFAQEARVLADLTHPAIVRYVAHGRSAAGAPFLAMEWLEGEDLAQRLGRAGLGVAESLTLVRRVAQGLAVAHARGIVHRDLKPSNVFLVVGDPSRAMLLDFGIVRLQLSRDASRPLTRSGMVLGTVGYMSPEQATADPALDARSDVFSLGCLLFECLTGERAFSGVHVVAVLAKILREEAPRIRQLRPELPLALDELVARMLSKARSGRPVDGDAVFKELDALGTLGGKAPSVKARSAQLSGGEQRLVSVMLAVVHDELDHVSRIVRRHGGTHARLANGALLVTLSGREGTGEQVVAAAVCALELRDAFSTARIALATGRAQTTSAGPPGPVIDQAAALLTQSKSPGIRVDELTAGLLAGRFLVREGTEGRLLVSRMRDDETPRTVLGKPTPCVGRDKELALLDATLRECIEDSVARAVVVTGPAGQGKSRVRHEFVSRARARGDVAIVVARADPVGAGSAFMLARQIVRHTIGLKDGEPGAEQARKLRSHVARVCSGTDVARIADFLGELIAISPPEEPSPQLRAARSDPQIMAQWLGRSFGDWLAGECATRALLIVLEDLHWGDPPSMTYLAESLLALAARPLMVLALARPEVHDAFPNLWAGAEKQELALGRLAPRAAERLVRAVMGQGVAGDAVSRIVERADGNAFYLEELIRHVSERGVDALPETVIALVQSRLDRLEPEARRVVRAASVFGEVFWRGGLAALLGAAADEKDVDTWLRALVEREVLTANADSRFRGEREFAFRHGLLRQAAYAMLTDEDRILGHRLAGDWLERHDEPDALLLAEHFDRGDDAVRAGARYLQAAKHANLGGGDATFAIAHVQRALAKPVPDELRIELLATLCESRFWHPESLVAMRPHAEELVRLAAPESGPWVQGMYLLQCCAQQEGELEKFVEILGALQNVAFSEDAAGPLALSFVAGATLLDRSGRGAQGDAVMERFAALARATGDRGLFVRAVWHGMSAIRATYREEDPWSGLRHAEQGMTLCRAIGHRRLLENTTVVAGVCWWLLGRIDEAVAAFDELTIPDEQLSYSSALRPFCRAWLLADRGDLGRARSWADRLVAMGRAQRFPHNEGRGHWLLAELLRREGKLEDAEAEIRTALALLRVSAPVDEPGALATLAALRLAQGKPAEALAAADEGVARFRTMGLCSTFTRGAFLRVVHLECLRAAGDHDAARAACAKVRERLLAAADRIPDAECRRSFLEHVPENRRTLELANQWAGENG